MGGKGILTETEFVEAIRAIPFAAARLDTWHDYEMAAYESDEEYAEYGLWHVLLGCVHAALEESNWSALRALLLVYDSVEQAGPCSEMYESSYVAFLEDVKIPRDRSELQEFLRHSPPTFKTHLTMYRGLP